MFISRDQCIVINFPFPHSIWPPRLFVLFWLLRRLLCVSISTRVHYFDSVKDSRPPNFYFLDLTRSFIVVYTFLLIIRMAVPRPSTSMLTDRCLQAHHCTAQRVNFGSGQVFSQGYRLSSTSPISIAEERSHYRHCPSMAL